MAMDAPGVLGGHELGSHYARPVNASATNEASPSHIRKPLSRMLHETDLEPRLPGGTIQRTKNL